MLIDRFIGCLFLCLCALLWFVIIPQQIPGEEQAMYPRLTIIFLGSAYHRKKYFFGSSGQGVFQSIRFRFPAYPFSYSELRRLYHEHGVRRIFCD